ncbi:iron-containing alcohol dehydrogenase [Sphingomonas sp. CL5.1]|uniref:iron-containing alcohol dehydrogenase n=1 Tax=Sphingomonas sp. CL5.1 TaxID=2653203 RepID=UPI0015815CDC|nr:iron-containing alcohol dehydrogenase [Sphingomonas sp. CL5.1]QKR99738.1 iron-containing alcohol dehydrogenase [Sphingomonas sp. CL5.1]
MLDTAKCIAVVARCGGSTADYALNPEKQIPSAVPIIAIPTTAGTGSEADIFAGVHPDSESAGVAIVSHHIIPQVAILDAEMTVTLPPKGTAATGIDALSHCIEGYLSKEDVPLAKLIALDGVRRGMKSIRRAVSHGSDIAARSEMLVTAYSGGVAMSMGTGPAHAIALTCSDQGFPHGILSGIGIVMTLDRVLSRLPAQKAALGEAMGLQPSEAPGLGFAQLMRDLGLPVTLAELGYIVEDIEALVQGVHAHFLNSFAYYPPDLSTCREIIRSSLSE